MKYPYNDFDIIQLTDCTSSLKLGNELIMLDNLDGENDTYNRRFQDYPVKLYFSVIIICLSGNISFRINLNNYTLKANDMLLAKSGDFGEFLTKSDDCKIITIAFTDEYFQSVSYQSSSISLQRIFHDNPVCHLSLQYTKECLTIFEMMKAKISETGNPYRKEALLGYIKVFIYNACFYFETTIKEEHLPVKKSKHNEVVFEKFIKTVQRDYREHRSILHYADELCMSAKYLSQVVKQVSGRLAGEWINDYVILEAKVMLKSRKYTIQQISDALNFTNQSFFGRFFKEKTGYSPSAYQKQE